VTVSDIDGSWNIAIATPMGTQKMTLALSSDETQLTGTASGDAGTLALRDGTIDGDSIQFAVDMTVPFAMALQFTLVVDGEAISGTSRAGSFPPSPVTGTRATSLAE
jgi:hypothetical protein